jgi:hypothetical protein
VTQGVFLPTPSNMSMLQTSDMSAVTCHFSIVNNLIRKEGINRRTDLESTICPCPSSMDGSLNNLFTIETCQIIEYLGIPVVRIVPRIWYRFVAHDWTTLWGKLASPWHGSWCSKKLLSLKFSNSGESLGLLIGFYKHIELNHQRSSSVGVQNECCQGFKYSRSIIRRPSWAMTRRWSV